MINHATKDFADEFPDNESCLEWLKNYLYPHGIECPTCKKVTKHHKVSKRPCYACDNCGNQTYPAARTVFCRSSTPLKTWFEVMHKVSDAKSDISAKEIQREYGMTYKTAKRVLQKTREFSDKHPSIFTKAKADKTYQRDTQLVTSYNGMQNEKPATGIIQRKAEENPGEHYWKRDRTARLLKLQMLLLQSPAGLGINEIARKCSVSKRTAYRDLRALESELGIPIWEEGSRRGIIEGHSLPTITFTPEEAMSVFLAIRLMQNYSYLHDPSIISTFIKLNMIIPEGLRSQIQSDLEYIESHPRDQRKINNFNKLAKAWLTKHRVKMRYQNSYEEEQIIECTIEPYYIEPSVLGHSSYVIAYCPSIKSIVTYKTDLIIGDVSIGVDTYEIPSDFKVTDYICSAWDLYVRQPEPELVKLRFTSKIRRIIMETVWHPSQRTEILSDGSGIITLKVRDTIYFRAWVLGWGDDVELLEPEAMRNAITQSVTSLAGIYTREKKL